MSIDKGLAASLAYSCSNQEVIEILMKARVMVEDWSERSIVNGSMTKGTFYNIMTNALSVDNLEMHKRNIIWEFGEYSSLYQKFLEEKQTEPHHEEPNEKDLSQFIKSWPKMEKIR